MLPWQEVLPAQAPAPAPAAVVAESQPKLPVPTVAVAAVLVKSDIQRCTFRLKVCQCCDFACDLRLFATFRHSAAIARCARRVAHFPRRSIPCGRKVPKVIATTHINMVTTLRNILHAKNLTVGDSWSQLHSDKAAGLKPCTPTQSLAHEVRATNK